MLGGGDGMPCQEVDWVAHGRSDVRGMRGVFKVSVES